MKRVVVLPAVLALILAAGVFGGHEQASAEGEKLVVKVGAGEAGYAVNQFLPSTVTVATGSTVSFVFEWFEVHHVAMFIGAEPAEAPAPDTSPATFPNDKKVVYSGDIFGDPKAPTTFDIMFTKAGTYDYQCFIHPGMNGTVKVVDAGAPGSGGIDNKFSVEARTAAQYTPALASLKEAGAAIKAGPDKSKPNGGRTVEAVLGAFIPALGQVQAMIPGKINIREGDSVNWVSRDGAPHNVVFGPPAQADPFEFPGAKSGSVYDGTGSLQSPIISQDEFGPGTLKSFEVVFSKAGTYNYICLLHADQGMVGQVVVASRGTTAPGAPNTGTGLADDGAGLGDAWSIVAAVLVLATIASALVVVRRPR